MTEAQSAVPRTHVKLTELAAAAGVGLGETLVWPPLQPGMTRANDRSRNNAAGRLLSMGRLL
jgi:hypothetical protein